MPVGHGTGGGGHELFELIEGGGERSAVHRDGLHSVVAADGGVRALRSWMTRSQDGAHCVWSVSDDEARLAWFLAAPSPVNGYRWSCIRFVTPHYDCEVAEDRDLSVALAGIPPEVVNLLAAAMDEAVAQ
jgi:hypothetical protein